MARSLRVRQKLMMFAYRSARAAAWAAKILTEGVLHVARLEALVRRFTRRRFQNFAYWPFTCRIAGHACADHVGKFWRVSGSPMETLGQLPSSLNTPGTRSADIQWFRSRIVGGSQRRILGVRSAAALRSVDFRSKKKNTRVLAGSDWPISYEDLARITTSGKSHNVA